MLPAGQRLRLLRESLGMTVRDVEAASNRLASKAGNEEYSLTISRLSDIETKGITPSIYRLYSLAVIYRTDLMEILKWYGIQQERWAEFANIAGAARTQTLSSFQSHQNVSVPVGFDPAFDLRKSTNIGRMIERWGTVPLAFLEELWKDEYTYAYVGMDDFTMYPLLMPGSFVQVDEKKDKVVAAQWRAEYERPIYLVESRDGFTVCWCALQGCQITLQSHPLSPVPTRVLKHPQEAEVVGQVVGLAMRLDWRAALPESAPKHRLHN